MSTANLLTTATNAAGAQNTTSMLVSLLPMVLIFVVFYFILIRPQKKRDKEIAKMRSNLEVGDEIVTIGGVVGRVVIIKEDTVVVETGSDAAPFSKTTPQLRELLLKKLLFLLKMLRLKKPNS